MGFRSEKGPSIFFPTVLKIPFFPKIANAKAPIAPMLMRPLNTKLYVHSSLPKVWADGSQRFSPRKIRKKSRLWDLFAINKPYLLNSIALL